MTEEANNELANLRKDVAMFKASLHVLGVALAAATQRVGHQAELVEALEEQGQDLIAPLLADETDQSLHEHYRRGYRYAVAILGVGGGIDPHAL